MNNFNTLCLGDFHIKDFQHKNQYLDKFEYEVSLESFKVIYKIIEDNNISKLLILGDFTDVAPQAEAIELAHTFLKGLPKGLEIIIIDGNHELIVGKAKKQYYWYGIKQKMLDNYNVKVLDYVEVDNALYCNHGNIHKLEKLTKNYDIVFSHFRSGISAIASDEIDVSLLNHKAQLVVASDIHTRLSFDNIVYTGSPIDTHFSSSNELPDHQPSVLLLSEETLDWKWADTLTNTHRKIKKVYPSVKKFLLEVEELEIRAKEYNLFYKIVIQDKKANLKQVNINNYKHFAIFELNHIDLMFDKENKKIDKQIIDNLSAKNVSNNLLDFIVKNCDRKELIENVKKIYHMYDVGSAKEAND